jgi:hypothetical protein
MPILKDSKIRVHAGLVKWHHETFPKFSRGSDSRIPLHLYNDKIQLLNGDKLGNSQARYTGSIPIARSKKAILERN